MQTVINEFNKTLAHEDLFGSWKDEIRLRSEIRTASVAWEGVQIDNAEAFGFIKRSLYYGNKPVEFFMILFQNMHNQTILNCVLESTPAFKVNFLHSLTNYILDQKPQSKDLLFLINMYQEELYSSFAEVIGAMDNELCSYLLPRTTNKALRKLIKSRQTQIAKQSQQVHYGLIDPLHPNNDYPTIYGDKIQIMAEAITYFKASRHESIPALLDGAELLYRAGLLTDCLAILTEMVKQKEDENVPFLCSEEPYFQQINQLLRKTLPIYTLLVNPAEPHWYALELYRSLYPGFNPDPASLLYLDIYTIIVANLQGYHQYARYELTQKAVKILSYRPDDLVARFLQNPGEKANKEAAAELELAITQRTTALPHESFVIMELLRLWQQEKRLTLEQEVAVRLFKHYQHFFHWIPGSTFINEQMLQQLGPLLNKSTRNTGKLIVSAIQEASLDKLSTKNKSNQGINVQENNFLHKQLLMGQFMEVL
ncbi:MAG: hypothetical protein CVU90_08125 [Firmicutes bacterium HGW-Firmicutes-15]|nr:MAG: hypothetical protein CVU90_08125 [Firmicutes bacterium HGW-Firmicutes-15]